ncbi:hypothetical protein [Streptomyces sp. NBC_01142]|uniref:hypothetical protein n=1 Tax=Streptomyces sp. NBC_01142 TaxID=2975865 RepID=UPI002B1E00D1|nr:hypothetical protein [Streptomyces sp. NBC_01142]
MSGTALAGLAAVGLFAVGCSTGGAGAQDEGAARADSAVKATPSAVPPSRGTGKYAVPVDAMKLLMNDPKVSDRVKADLKPCGRDAYPVDTSYGNLTGGASPDVVLNVMTCGDAVGMGTYVYREIDKKYENVFAAEEPTVYSAIDRGDLVVTKQVFAKGNSIAEPSGEEVTTYRWSGGKFAQQYWVRNEFSRAVGEGEAVAPEPPTTTEN